MSNYKIFNNKIEVNLRSMGAEICSIKKNGLEYMWSGDPKYWGGVSPMLFPFIGNLIDGQYRYMGKAYSIDKHGFAREKEFEIVFHKDNEICFRLKYDGETLKQYPFKFTLDITYKIENDTIHVLWKVVNLENKKMYFAIGGHPGFACPMGENKKKEDSYLKFTNKNNENLDHIKSTSISRGGFALNEYKTYKLNKGKLAISEDLFMNDALVLEDDQVKGIALVNDKDEEYVKVEFDSPVLGVWSRPDNNARYICIEPWYGRCDSEDFKGELEDRDWIRTIKGNGEFSEKYKIII